MNRWLPFVLLAAAWTLAPGSPRAACVRDDTGAKVCVDAAAPRIVSLYGAYTELLWEIGAGGLVVGRTRNDRTIPAVRRLPSVGTGLRPNVEYVLALRPDLVVARAGRAARAAVADLRARGLTVAAFDPRGFDDLYHTIERVGRLVGRTNGAADLVGRIRSRIEAVRRRTAREPPLRVVYEVRAQPLTVAGTDSLMDQIIRAAGGMNAVTRPKKLLMLDMEALLRLDPDVYIVQRGPMNRNPLHPSLRPLFRNLRAVRQGAVLVVDETRFARPGPRVADAVEELARFLHPTVFQ